MLADYEFKGHRALLRYYNTAVKSAHLQTKHDYVDWHHLFVLLV